ncbi:uncharacterized protein FRV6_14894 [Fusarium oxysporum]|uniref:Uncharacterized protein n=2 Tax=Fusarium oxysporum TaxID=5507 RepID=A0A2H3U5Q2_FUSOX|nr:hypothetical protein FOTG_15472 [Fusarium oxysporum f. sp. vasinfectum 25433]SCO90766.1 uncharacterized protein FRV6_14894 [Fusarium oxysporum]
MGSPPFSFTFPSPNVLSIIGWKFDIVVSVSSKFEFVDIHSDFQDLRPYLREKNILPIEAVSLQLLRETSGSPEELTGPFSSTLARGSPAPQDYTDDLLFYCEILRNKAGTVTDSPFPRRSSRKSDLVNAVRVFQ